MNLATKIGLGAAAASGIVYGALRIRRQLQIADEGCEPIRTMGPLTGGVPSFTKIAANETGQVELSPGWVSANLVSVSIPELAKVKGGAGKLTLHKDVGKALQEAFAELEREGILGDVTSFDGGWNPRLIRGSETELSKHAMGTAIDLNARENPLGALGPGPGEPGNLFRVARVLRAHGFRWGRCWKRPDPMHFEYVG